MPRKKYISPGLTDFSNFNIKQSLKAQAELQKILDQHPDNLGEKLSLLYLQQRAAGFILDDLSNVYRVILRDSKNPEHWLAAQNNPKRKERFKGFGLAVPPPSVPNVNNGCFLCRKNIIWQQRGLQKWYRFKIDDSKGKQNEYVGLCNPFPLMPWHLNLTAGEHTPQGWITDHQKESQTNINRIINDLMLMAAEMPGYILFYNGIKAGATIEGHRHYHAFRRLPGPYLFPVEAMAAKLKKSGCQTPFLIEGYPIATVYFNNCREAIKERAVNFLHLWTEYLQYSQNLSANIICCLDTSSTTEEKKFHLYLVPRDTNLSMSPGRRGVVAGLEGLGEIAFSEESEKNRLEAGLIKYEDAASMLKAVEPHGIIDFFKENRNTLNL